MTHAEFLRFHRQLRQEYRRKFEALRFLYGGLGNQSIVRPGEVQSRVLAAIEKLSGNFCVEDVQKSIHQADPLDASLVSRSAVSLTLLRLARKNALQIVRPGTGRMPTLYAHSNHEPTSGKRKRARHRTAIPVA